MLIIKVMVCFLAVFRSEFNVGGLPTIQDSPDNHDAGQSGRSASNQRVTNEPAGSPPVELLDYAAHRDQEVQREPGTEIKVTKNLEKSLPHEIAAQRFTCSNSTVCNYPALYDDDNIGGDRPSLRGYSRTDQSNSDKILDKSKSRNVQATTSHDFPTESRVLASSHGAPEAQRFSSVYTELELDAKVNKKKQEFKNDLSHYLSDVIDSVVSRNASNESAIENSNVDDVDAPQSQPQIRMRIKSGNETSGNLLIRRREVPVPEEDLKLLIPIENRERKSIGDVVTWHQQSTNMRPTRTQHLWQNKRSPGEGTLLKLPGYGGRKSERTVGGGNRSSNRRQFTIDGPSSPRVQLQLAELNPIQVNAAMAYSNRQIAQQALNIDLSRALYQFSPAQLHALRGVFDKVPPSTQNFKPIAPKQVAYVPPRIVYETKIVPTPFMPFRTEQKTVQALSALLGRNPAQQLEGFNLILRKDEPKKNRINTAPAPNSIPEISRQSINEPVALGQAFVTPVPSIEINSGLGDEIFSFAHDGRDPNEELSDAAEGPFHKKTPLYPVPDNVNHHDDQFKSIPIIEESHETIRGEPTVEKELHPVWERPEITEVATAENEGRYSEHNNQEENSYGEGYAAKYNFGYHVKDYESGNNFGHQEARDGVVTNGRYHVLLPDGRVQDVKYHVDEGGYHAKVSYQLNHSV